MEFFSWDAAEGDEHRIVKELSAQPGHIRTVWLKFDSRTAAYPMSMADCDGHAVKVADIPIDCSSHIWKHEHVIMTQILPNPTTRDHGASSPTPPTLPPHPMATFRASSLISSYAALPEKKKKNRDTS